MVIAVGTRVFCAYREPSTLQPWTGKRHEGVVLALEDPRAWQGSGKFGDGLPSARAVAEHVAWCLARSLFADGRRPVLYDFGVRWDTQLYPVALDIARCAGCRQPAHPTETNDLDQCAACAKETTP